MQRREFTSQREIIDALEDELRVSGGPLNFTVSEVKPDGAALFKVFINSADSSHGLDESLEGAAAAWPGPPKGTADVLSVSAEHDQINIRYLSGPPPRKGGQIVLHTPRYLEALRDIWKSPLFAEASLGWLEKVTALNYSPLPDVRSVPGFPELRDRQRQAFGLAGSRVRVPLGTAGHREDLYGGSDIGLVPASKAASENLTAFDDELGGRHCIAVGRPPSGRTRADRSRGSRIAPAVQTNRNPFHRRQLQRPRTLITSC